MTDRRHRQKGVTLPELLIALLVFALISSVGVYLLRLSVDGRAQLTEADAALREWQLARLIIRQDLTQATLRTVRDEFGQRQRGPFVGGLGFAGRLPVENETPLFAFTRRGWAAADPDVPRSTLQYVEYILIGDDIVRRVRPYLDDARDQPRRDRVMFEDVDDVEVRFLVGENARGLEWSEDWAEIGTAPPPPQALRMTFTSDRFGEIEQLFWIGELNIGAPT